MEWNLRACARHGHATYRPDEPELAARLSAQTVAGPAWRCLRCEAFVVGAPAGGGPAADAPTILRGKALRSVTILRLLAVERVVRALLIVGIAYAILRFRSAEGHVQQLFDRALPAAKPLADVLHIDLDHSPTITKLQDLLHTRPSTLLLVSALLFGYAALQLVEGVGLWLNKRWGEYFASVATAAFLPLEVYELTERITWLRVVTLLINLAAVVYLVASKRLFGVRGGAAAYEAERAETSLLEIERSAVAGRPDERTRVPRPRDAAHADAAGPGTP